MTLVYQLPGAVWELALSVEVATFLHSQAQRRFLAPESMGQLYARDLLAPRVVIEKGTKLRARYAWVFNVSFDPAEAARERRAYFAQGYHCIGIWHSHPERCPRPSAEDIRLAQDFARAAQMQVTGIAFVIVGTDPFPHGLGVWVHDGIQLLRATAAA